MIEATAGVPVYNNGDTLARAVESLLAQTRPPARVLISDNASTDSTQEVGRELARRNPTVEYVRQDPGIGSSGNFRFLLGESATPYFMWLAADDFLLPRFIEVTAGCLDAGPGVVSCASKVEFRGRGVRAGLASGSEALTASIPENLAHYLNMPGANVRIYGLHRTQALQAAFPPSHFHAFDWAAMAGMLLRGNQAEVDEVLMIRDETPGEAYVHQVREDNKGRFNWLFPLMPLTRDLLVRQRIPIDWDIGRALARINLEHHFQYAAQYHPRYYSILGRRLAAQIWRLEPRKRR